ncbi:response regulator [Reichenbachiella sp. MALMAid0571]|uniref:response regulator n=1 Tax=Reichenbachiella sp. MALMAid0571 TaxID=3143939 RepID=UPI0032E006CD
MNVLYVDDQKENLNVFRIAFKRYYTVFVAESGEEALDILSANQIDVVIADHRMPELTGIELLVKVGELYVNTKKIIISEYINDKVIRDAMKAFNFDGCMSKPWNGEELKKMIEQGI